MPRQARLDSPGTLHHVIIRGIEKRDIVNDNNDRENMVARLGDLVEETKTVVYAWALMLNHMHILLKSGADGLSKFMRRLLTGYAITYNIRHKRHGHLFQNRYKSIVCDEETYFQELVRYIHLNPLRAEIVKNISELDHYPWSGHSAIMGREKREWQDIKYVLSWFGKNDSDARREYHAYIMDGIKNGHRDDLVGGGLIRTLGGWSQVLSLRQNKENILTDERILGKDEFVARVLSEADNRIMSQLSINKHRINAEKEIHSICSKEGVNFKELKGGSRRGCLSEIRARLALKLVRDRGLTMAETARQLGVCTSAISRILERNGKS
ncbi:MAG: transposase [Deltaproteobacteria bacterium]|nr:transposase [Deltaproteobacteria bacterium]